ncbi:DUF3460 family protein [Xylophilus sp. Leaf220]|uniref:DUF3460 family protein n=1 Tax=Xylophilus sp. Leaf220 TaxID=1735686 RepID=UPI0006F7C024|nr:DUF3460 family protein [Xylophilus sp. Leaf220]KQM80271.1 acetyl-CoA carboxyl transferase [Xylophilus sp. Leaf220]
MSFFNRAHYTSDATQFINQLKEDNPAIEEGQRAGRALLWDKKVDRDARQDYDAGDIAQKPYVYQTDASKF